MKENQLLLFAFDLEEIRSDNPPPHLTSQSKFELDTHFYGTFQDTDVCVCLTSK